MLIKKPSDVAIEPVQMEDAEGVTVQVLGTHSSPSGEIVDSRSSNPSFNLIFFG